jgi:plastocyanin
MSLWGHRISVKVFVLIVPLLTVGALLPAFGRPPAREITLVARGMAFYLESDPATPNPAIEVKAGERVRVVLRNQDRGFTHDFAVPASGAALGAITWNQAASVTFTVPAEPGIYEYTCRPHFLMMRGRFIVIP